MAALIVFGVTFAAYAWTASPALGWLDSPELVAAAASLGVPHPPSHPPAVLLGRALQLLPFGDAAFRVNLASALAVACAAAFVTVAGKILLSHATPALGARTRALVAAAAALVFAFTWAAWHQAVRAEVYGLLAACLLGALALALHGGARQLAAAGLLAGLALATHWFVAALCLAPIAIAALRRGRAHALGAAALLAVGSAGAALAYLPLRAARDPVVLWGDPDTASRFAWTVSARAFAKALDRPSGAHGIEAAQVVGALVEQLTPVLFVVALAGAYLLLRRGETRRRGLLLVGVAACVAAGPALVAFDPENPDAYGYLVTSLAALALLAAAAVGVLAALLPERVRPLAAVVVFAFVPWQLAAHGRESSLYGGEDSDRWARAVLERLPPRALLATSYFETQFQTWALVTVEGARPDVERVDRAMARWPGSRVPRRGLDELAAEAARRPVRVEPGIDLPADPRLVPLAIVDDATLDALAAPEPGAPPHDRRGLERVLLWQSFLRARIDCDARALRRASALAPADPLLEELRSTCNR